MAQAGRLPQGLMLMHEVLEMSTINIAVWGVCPTPQCRSAQPFTLVGNEQTAATQRPDQREKNDGARRGG